MASSSMGEEEKFFVSGSTIISEMIQPEVVIFLIFNEVNMASSSSNDGTNNGFFTIGVFCVWGGGVGVIGYRQGGAILLKHIRI